MAEVKKMLNREHSFKMTDGQSIAYKILGILMVIAPNARAQAALDKFYKDYPAGIHQDRAMVGALYDGLAFGNWPWKETTHG